MKRRYFNKLTTTAMMTAPFLGVHNSYASKESRINEILQNLIEANDGEIPGLMERQEKDPDHKWFGGIKDANDIFSAGSAAGFIKNMVCAFTAPTSKYFHENQLIDAMVLAAKYLVNCQYEDGTIDLPSTNFHSTPDTGFVVEPLCLAYTLLLNDKSANSDRLLAVLKQFLINAGDALTVGGIHTPNHRWVVSMALARVNILFPNHKYVDRIDQWLAEKIDIDADGQYTEKSTFIYTPLVNRCLITIARLATKSELYIPVRKNLEMSLYFKHANGEIATESSGRQDKYQRGTMENYYYAYRYMAVMDKNKVFAAMTDELENTIPEKLGFWLIYMLEDKNWLTPLAGTSILPVDYVKDFKGSNIIRIRRGTVDASILIENSAFFNFFNNNAALEAIRFASAFFGKGQFVSQQIVREGKGWKLSQQLVGPYYQPLDSNELPGDGDWAKMPRMKRPLSEVQQLESTIMIHEHSGTFELEFNIEGTANVPVAVELAFRKGGKLKGTTEAKNILDAYLSQNAEPIIYEFEGDKIEIDSGLNEHAWTQLRGALPKLDAMSVYLTGFTPFNKSIVISAG